MQAGKQLAVILAGTLVHAGTALAASPEAGHGMQSVVLKGIGIAIVVAVFGYTVKCFLRPGEDDSQHIKRRILRDHW